MVVGAEIHRAITDIIDVEQSAISDLQFLTYESHQFPSYRPVVRHRMGPGDSARSLGVGKLPLDYSPWDIFQ
jgi:hypothetical protein